MPPQVINNNLIRIAQVLAETTEPFTARHITAVVPSHSVAYTRLHDFTRCGWVTRLKGRRNPTRYQVTDDGRRMLSTIASRQLLPDPMYQRVPDPPLPDLPGPPRHCAYDRLLLALARRARTPQTRAGLAAELCLPDVAVYQILRGARVAGHVRVAGGRAALTPTGYARVAEIARSGR